MLGVALKLDSARYTWKRCFYLQGKISVISVDITYPFDDLDHVTHSFKDTGAHPANRTGN